MYTSGIPLLCICLNRLQEGAKSSLRVKKGSQARGSPCCVKWTKKTASAPEAPPVAPKWTNKWSNPPKWTKNNKCARTPEPPKNKIGCNRGLRALKRVKRAPGPEPPLSILLSSGACTTVVQKWSKKQQVRQNPHCLYYSSMILGGRLFQSLIVLGKY